MKPLRITLFLLSVIILLLSLSFLIPAEGIPLGAESSIRFFKLSRLLDISNAEADSISRQILAFSDLDQDPESDRGVDLLDLGAAGSGRGDAAGGEPGTSASKTKGTPDPAEEVSHSSTDGPGHGEVSNSSAQKKRQEEGISKPVVLPANKDSLRATIRSIELPAGQEDYFYSFFRNLDTLVAGSTAFPTRVLHFGDSQIEVDRMTALIRYRLQKHFGGAGLGLVQAIPLYSGSMSYKQQVQGEWLRYTFFGKRDSSISHSSFGLMGAFSSVPAISDSLWPSISYQFNQARRSGWTDHIRVFMHSYVDSSAIAIEINGEFRDTLFLLPDGYSVADFRYNGNVLDLRLSFAFPEGGRLYGLSFEHSEGMQMDNIAMRGSSGLLFTQLNRELQASMLEDLNPGLIILQFGGNVVPYMTPSYYGRQFARQLALFKELCPGVPVVVIGPGDMSTRHNGRFVSYPNLEAINHQLRQAALGQGCAFWNLFEAMGGEGSMPSFVNSDPPLASKDHIHFSPLGINLVAEMFYNALMLEYRNQQALQP